MSDVVVVKQDCNEFLQLLPKNSVDLILTDPPYAISKNTGFQGSKGKKTIERFAISMDFGEWDHKEIDISLFMKNSYKCLRKGGTLIVFYDLWKMNYLAEEMTKAGFKQLRFIEWLKRNPVPINSKYNYLTNCREIAVSSVKIGKPTFNGKYDNGVYSYPIPNNEKRYHPTQKPLELMKDLIKKHSNKGDLVVDPFLGSGTTGLAAVFHNRRFAGCDVNEKYVDIARKRMKMDNISLRRS